MKRIMVYIAALAASLLLPMRGMDVGKLQPVGLIQLYIEDETVFIVTDTGDSGCGKTVEAAFENLEQTTSGVIFWIRRTICCSARRQQRWQRNWNRI